MVSFIVKINYRVIIEKWTLSYAPKLLISKMSNFIRIHLKNIYPWKKVLLYSFWNLLYMTCHIFLTHSVYFWRKVAFYYFFFTGIFCKYTLVIAHASILRYLLLWHKTTMFSTHTNLTPIFYNVSMWTQQLSHPFNEYDFLLFFITETLPQQRFLNPNCTLRLLVFHGTATCAVDLSKSSKEFHEPYYYLAA